MERGKYLFKNTLVFALGNLGTKLINFFLVPMYTNILLPSEYGTVDLVFTICTIAIPFLILNINEAIMRFALDKNADQNQIMSIGLLTILLSCVSGILLWYFAGFYKPVAAYKNYIYGYAITYGMSDIFLCYLRGKELLLLFSLGNILRTFTIASLNIWFLVGLKLGVEGYFLAYIIANVVTMIFGFFAGNVKEVFKHFSINKKLAKEMINYSFWLIPTSLMWWIIHSSDRVMVTAMISVSASGIYAASSKLPAFISTISTIFNQAFSYSAIRENDSEDSEEFNNTIFGYLLSLVIFCGIFLLAIIKPLMSVYVGRKYSTAWFYTPPLIVGTCIMVLGTFFSVYYTVNKDSKGFLKSGSAGAILNIIFNFMLIPTIGTIGAAIATAVSYIAVAIYRYYDIKKYIKLDVFNKVNVCSLIMLFLAGGLVYCNTVITFVGCMILLVLFCVINRKSLKEAVLKVLRRKK